MQLGRKHLAALAALTALAFAPAAQAQTTAPPGVTVEQGYGFATVAWGAVAGATEYEIERTALAGRRASGPALTVGPLAADAVQRAGPSRRRDDVRRLRVRARRALPLAGAGCHVRASRRLVGARGRHHAGGDRPGGAPDAVRAQRRRAPSPPTSRKSRICRRSTPRASACGSTRSARPDSGVRCILATIGAPAPKSPKDIAKGNSVVIECTIHGGERAPREACMTLIRWLALSNDVWATRILSRATVLIYPTANPDGQVLGERTGPTGQDLNRDHILIRHPETFAMAKVLRDHQPDMLIDGHELGIGPDIQWLWPRSPGVGDELWELAQEHMTRGAMFDASGAFGWSSGIWPTHRTDNWETLINNTAGLKNIVGQLEETPQQSGAARPNAPSGSAANQQRRAYSHLWSFRQHLDYHAANLPRSRRRSRPRRRGTSSNDGPIYLDGARDVPVPPPSQEPSTKILDTPPCGYLLTAEQSRRAPAARRRTSCSGRRPRRGAAGRARRGDREDRRRDGAGAARQPLRALIPYMLDPDLESPVRIEGLPNLSMVEGVRLADRGPTGRHRVDRLARANRVGDDGLQRRRPDRGRGRWPSHGAFLKHVGETVLRLTLAREIGLLEAAAITVAAARSGVGR